MKNVTIAVIGGGAGGLMVAGKLANYGFSTTLFEKNEKLGKKIYITGKGRCNLTNYCSETEFLDNVVNNPKFLYSAIYKYNSQYVVDFFNNIGLETKIERGNRVFPLSDKSSDVIKVLKDYCLKNGVKVKLNSNIQGVKKVNDKFELICNKDKHLFDIVIIATGGKSYQSTGSTGDGYEFAKSLGHNIIKPVPALVPMIASNNFEGISLKNVSLTAKENGKVIKSLFGEMLFTHNGISGPIALSLSSYINRKEVKDIDLFIDFKPALSLEKLITRIERDVQSLLQKQVSTLIQGLLPKNMEEEFLNNCNIDRTTKCKSLNKKDIEKIAFLLKNYSLKYNGLYDINFGIITSGGVSIKEINSKTLCRDSRA